MSQSLKQFEHIAYDQGNEIDKALGEIKKQRSDVAGGICFSLCCQWMELHKNYHGMGGGEKYRIDCMQSRMKSLMSDSVFFYRAMNSQAGDYSQNYSSKLEQKNATGKKYGLKFVTAQPGTRTDLPCRMARMAWNASMPRRAAVPMTDRAAA